jgi:transposase
MDQAPVVVVGCDVSKLWVDVCCQDGARARTQRLSNESASLKRWAKSLPGVCRVGMEATGTYHLELACALVQAGHTVYVINPRWIHAYANSVGQRGKTDRTDAALIARYVQREDEKLHVYEPPGPEQAQLRRLLLRRQEMVKLRSATRQSLGREAAQVLKQFDVLVRGLEKQIRELIDAQPSWRELAKRLRQIPGVGFIVAAYLVQVLTRFAFARADSFIAHTGTDPRPRDSGQKRGRRRISHRGDSTLRQMIFMAGMAAIKKPEWHRLYEGYRQRGLPSTGAIVAIGRKLARVAWHMFNCDEPYDPSKVSAAPAA